MTDLQPPTTTTDAFDGPHRRDNVPPWVGPAGNFATMIRTFIGLAIGFLGGWLLWNVGGSVFTELNNGSDVLQSLSYPPTMLRLLASLAAFSAGLATLTNFTRVGVWLAGIATFMFAILAFGLMANGADGAMLSASLIYLACLTALFLGLFITRQRRGASEA